MNTIRQVFLLASLSIPSIAGAQNPPVTKGETALTLPDGALRRLRRIEGSWRGSGTSQQPFFERYRFADDSTMIVETFADSTFGRVTEAARYELRGGSLTNVGNGPRWIATSLDDASVVFAPLQGARNSFVWQRGTADQWTATINWTADGRPQERVYTMRRVQPGMPKL